MPGSRKYVLRTFLPALILFVLCCHLPPGYADGRLFLQLTEKEKAFVAEHPVIRVSNEMDWPPFDFMQNGELFALVDTAPKIGFHIQENQMVDLKISGEMPYQMMFHTGISKNDTMLHSIFEKAIHSVSDEDRKHIFQTWMTLKYEQRFDYGLVWTIALVMGIIGFFAVYRHISISGIISGLQD